MKMYKEQDLLNVREMYKMSEESEASYLVVVHNVIIGINEAVEKGEFYYTHWQELPKVFCGRLNKWLGGLGYGVEFKELKESELIKVYIKWDFPNNRGQK